MIAVGGVTAGGGATAAGGFWGGVLARSGSCLREFKSLSV